MFDERHQLSTLEIALARAEFDKKSWVSREYPCNVYERQELSSQKEEVQSIPNRQGEYDQPVFLSPHE